MNEFFRTEFNLQFLFSSTVVRALLMLHTAERVDDKKIPVKTGLSVRFTVRGEVNARVVLRID
jgi:hypothetical protein